MHEVKSGSRLEQLCLSGEFVVTAELGPPKGADARAIREAGKVLGSAADAVNITDNQTAIVRLSSIAAGKILLENRVIPMASAKKTDKPSTLRCQSSTITCLATTNEEGITLTTPSSRQRSFAQCLAQHARQRSRRAHRLQKEGLKRRLDPRRLH